MRRHAGEKPFGTVSRLARSSVLACLRSRVVDTTVSRQWACGAFLVSNAASRRWEATRSSPPRFYGMGGATFW